MNLSLPYHCGVKSSNLPDYWTREGLSRVASVVGVPLSADELTSRLEILPFAKLCVQYKVGDPLPNSITVVDLDPSSGCKSNVEVKVSYQNKPQFYSNCKSLGYIVNVCPHATFAKRAWVQKSSRETPIANNQSKNSAPEEPQMPENTAQYESTCAEGGSKRTDEVVGTDTAIPVNVTSVNSDEVSPLKNNEQDAFLEDEAGWTEVRTKRKPMASPTISADSPSPQVLSSDVSSKKKGVTFGRVAHKKSKKALGNRH